MSLMVNGFFPGELEPSATVGGCIEIFENVWPNCQQTIDILEAENANPNNGVSWQRAETIGQGPYQSARTNFTIPITHWAHIQDNKALQNIHNQFNMLLLAATNPYAMRHHVQENFYHEPYSVLKYGEGQEYKVHYDGGTDTGRSISALVYLNNDFEGGELEFPHFNLRIKPEPGMLILFPSNYAYAHSALPIKKGTKYALVTWIRDREVSDARKY